VLATNLRTARDTPKIRRPLRVIDYPPRCFSADRATKRHDKALIFTVVGLAAHDRWLALVHV